MYVCVVFTCMHISACIYMFINMQAYNLLPGREQQSNSERRKFTEPRTCINPTDPSSLPTSNISLETPSIPSIEPLFCGHVKQVI